MYKRRKRGRKSKRRRKQRGGFGGFGGFGGVLGGRDSYVPFRSTFRKLGKIHEFSKQKGFLNKAKYLFKNIKLIKYV